MDEFLKKVELVSNELSQTYFKVKGASRLTYKDGTAISTLEGCRRRRTLSLRPYQGQVKQSTSLRRWQGIELKRRLDLKLPGWTIQLPSMVTSP